MREIIKERYNFDIKPFDWNTSLWYCCEDLPICLKSTVCPMMMLCERERAFQPSCDFMDHHRENEECFDCFKHYCCGCCEDCFGPSLILVLYTPLCLFIGPVLEANERIDFVDYNFETRKAKESRGGKQEYFKCTNCMIGCFCWPCSLLQIRREKVIRGENPDHKTLTCDKTKSFKWDMLEDFDAEDRAKWERERKENEERRRNTTNEKNNNDDENEEDARIREQEADEADRKRIEELQREMDEVQMRRRARGGNLQPDFVNGVERRNNNNNTDEVHVMPGDVAFGKN